MVKLSDVEMNKAYLLWRYSLDVEQQEEVLAPFLDEKIKAYSGLDSKISKNGWLRQARQGLLLSTQHVAQNLGISRAAYSKFEEGEEKGTISLNTLSRAAQAMNCELVYAIRPKQKQLFSILIWQKLAPVALSRPWLKACDPKRKVQALVSEVKKLLKNSQFRKKQNWVQQKTAE
ncbi:MAG: helix-turn-helix domain-containing protein [Pseudobdellovibrionaceae bacterium]